MNFQQQTQQVKRAVESISLGFEDPDDDWLPVLLLFGADKNSICPIDFNGPESKEHFARSLPGIVADKKPRFAALVLPSWQRIVTAEEPLAELTVSMLGRFGVRSDPKREEIILLETSDGAETGTWVAKVTRYKDLPPTLGPWEEWEGPREGRMAGVLHKNMQLAREGVR